MSVSMTKFKAFNKRFPVQEYEMLTVQHLGEVILLYPQIHFVCLSIRVGYECNGTTFACFQQQQNNNNYNKIQCQ